MLDVHEEGLLMEAGVRGYPHIFVLGPPRSGTTLLYQLMVQSLGLAYFCNIVDEHPRFAVTLTRLLRSRMRSHQSDFESNYGRTKSIVGPSEGLHIWRQWFPDSYIDEHYLTDRMMLAIQQTLGAISETMQSSFVNKDPHHCVRVRVLNSLFPNALFIVIKRDPVATAESMLK
ncbi:MAG: sulfotransferase, partial [Saprospiraceae bacterium]|nr:sulfotransferase [Saprospiraceae bacterium]